MSNEETSIYRPETRDEADVDYSHEIATTVLAAAHELQETLPEYAGVTMFGSTVRGEAGPDSDADMFVFVTPTDREGSPQANPRIAPGATISQMRDAGSYIGSHPFHGAIEVDYKMHVLDVLQRNGVPNAREADVAVVPLTEQIVSEEAKFLLATAASDEDQQAAVMASAQAFRNVRAMFHAPIDAVPLQSFQRQIIAELAESPHGEEAWSMLRKKVVGFEAGRDNGNVQQTPWRYIPENLDEAVQYYFIRQ